MTPPWLRCCAAKVIAFMADSTTRSDLTAWEDAHGCPRTDKLGDKRQFQKKDKDGTYVCRLWEQSINLTRCGIPPIVQTECPAGVTFRYFYKVYPWAPLDEWYLAQPDLLRDVDAVVISLGRWFEYYEPQETFNVTKEFETFIVSLQKVYSGIILYQSEYARHEMRSADAKFHVPCQHATCRDCPDTDPTQPHECAQTITEERPRSDIEMRSVLERYRIPYLDRWSISKSLPLEYFKLWYCNDGQHSQWDCDHHLYFVAMQHSCDSSCMSSPVCFVKINNACFVDPFGQSVVALPLSLVSLDACAHVFVLASRYYASVDLVVN